MKTARQLVEEASRQIVTLSLDEARALHGSDGPLFVDLRDVRELEREGVIPGAFHAPRGVLEFWVDPQSEYFKPVFSPGRRLVLFCAAGWRSALAAKTLQARASVPLQCQRCLQQVLQDLNVDRRFRFVRSEEEAERLDESSEDDVLVLGPRLDLQELLEDELILALPLVPKHDGPCPAPLPMPLDELEDEAPAPSPFAALAALRTGRGSLN